MPRKRPGTETQSLDKARVLEALAKEPQGSKRDLARVLGVKGSERITLKRTPAAKSHHHPAAKGHKK